MSAVPPSPRDTDRQRHHLELAPHKDVASDRHGAHRTLEDGSVGKRLRAAREFAGLTQRQLAERSRVSQQPWIELPQ